MRSAASLFLFSVIFLIGFLYQDQQTQNVYSERNISSAEDSQPIFTLKTISEMDKSKPVVCSITINSDEEKKVFHSNLSKNFNVLELVDEKSETWFEDTCRSNIQCEILIISGHFGGSFFGKSNHTISVSRLESLSCDQKCSGVFKNPKEVFLFGCNTMAGKEPDHRTPEEYADILYNDHREVYHSREIAELHAAVRYSPVGLQTQDKMRRVFPNAKIYGFSSVAPSGKNIEGQLEKYFKAVPNYLNSYKSEKGNVETWQKLMSPFYTIRTLNGFGPVENPICILGSSEPIIKKLSWINSILRTQNGVLTYAPNIYDYLKQLEVRFGRDWDKWPRTEATYMEHLRQNKEAEKTIESFLQNPLDGLLTVKIKVLNMAEMLGWFDLEKRKSIQKSLIGDYFKDNLTLEKKDFICSSEIELNISLSDLPNVEWNEYTIDSLACVKPQDKKIHTALVKLLKHPDLRYAASKAIYSIKLIEQETLWQILNLLDASDSESRIVALSTLGELKPERDEAQVRIIKALQDPDPNVRRSCAVALGKIRPKREDFQLAVAQALSDKNSAVRYFVGDALKKIKPQSKKVQQVIIDAGYGRILK